MHTHDEEARKYFRHSGVHCVLSPRYASNKLSIFKQQVWILFLPFGHISITRFYFSDSHLSSYRHTVTHSQRHVLVLQNVNLHLKLIDEVRIKTWKMITQICIVYVIAFSWRNLG